MLELLLDVMVTYMYILLTGDLSSEDPSSGIGGGHLPENHFKAEKLKEHRLEHSLPQPHLL